MASIPAGSTWCRSSRPPTACFARANGPRDAKAFPALTNGVRAPATIATLCSLTEPLLGNAPPSPTPILLPEACSLEPAAHAGLVVPIGVAEPPFQVRFLARDDAVADRDCQRQREDQGPRASCGYTDAAVDEKHAEIDGIADPAVNAGRHQRAGGPVRGYRRPCP